MRTDRKYIKLIIFGLFSFIIAVSSGYSFAQTSKGEGEEATKVEDERMTKEGQAALVAASQALQSNDFATAEKTLVDYLATNPTYKPELLYQMLGSSYYNQEKFSEAANIYKEAYQLFPEKPEFFSNQIVCTIQYAEKNNDKKAYIDAAKLFEKLYEVEKSEDSLKNAALAYYQGEDLKEAKRIFIKIYESKSEPDLEILDTIYKLCEELGQKDEMKKYLLQMMDINPLRYEYWILLAQMYSETNDYTNIAATLEIAYDIKTPEKKNLDNLIDLYSYLNVPLRTSKTLVKNSDKVTLDNDDYKRIINGYYVTNRTDKAVSYIDEVNNKKKDTELMLQKANILLEARKDEEAIKAADDIIAFDPKQGMAYMIKGYAAWDMENWQLAKEAFDKATSFSSLRDSAQYYIGVIESLENAKADLDNAIAEAKANKGTTAFSPSE